MGDCSLIQQFHQIQKSFVRLLGDLLIGDAQNSDLHTELQRDLDRLKAIGQDDISLATECESWHSRHQSVYHLIACHDPSVWSTPGTLRLVSTGIENSLDDLASRWWTCANGTDGLGDAALDAVWDHLKSLARWAGIHCSLPRALRVTMEECARNLAEDQPLTDEMACAIAVASRDVDSSQIDFTELMFHICLGEGASSSAMPYWLLKRRFAQNMQKDKKKAGSRENQES